MRPQNPALRDALAAEYVLGTLRGLARDRFERWLKDDPGLRSEVNTWEELLAGFNAGIAPVPAPERLWQAIELRLGMAERKTSAPAPAVPGLRWWRGAWLSLSVAALLVMALVFRPDVAVDDFAPDMQLVLHNKEQRPVWQIQADTRHNRLMVSALRPVQLPDDRSLELWLLPKSGGPPISLGLMPTRMENSLVVTANTALIEAAAYAVSLEPQGGSPTGAPTGPVLYVQETGTS